MVEKLTSLLSRRHPESRPSLPSTAEILARRTSFKWKGKQEWAGFSRNDLKQLVGIIATLIGIPPHQAEKISVIFADHFDKKGSDGGASAYCDGIYLKSNTLFTECLVVFNRSLELANYCLERDRVTNEDQSRLQSLGVYGDTPDAKPIICQFENEEEAIIWMIAEELKHAHVNFIAKTYKNFEHWASRYLQIMRSKGRNTNHLYDTDLTEITANRTVLRILAKLSTGERRAYFRQLYQESLERGHIVISFLYEPVFISTGFSPKKTGQKATKGWRGETRKIGSFSAK